MVQTSDETAPQSLLTPSVHDENRKNKPVEESNEMVTLTKTQLRAILEALSQVGKTSDSKPEKSEQNKLEDNNINGKSIPDAKSHYNGRCGAHTRNSSLHEDIAINSKKIGSNGKIGPPCTSVMPQAASNIKPTAASRLERKRQQWAKERAEMEDWNPWGKPGAGAPRPRRSSTSPVFPRVESRTTLVPSPSNSSFPTRSSLSSPLQTYHSPCETPAESPSPHLITFSNSMTKPSTSAFSFPQDSVDSTEDTKTQWIEREREEERQRYFLERDRLSLSRQFKSALLTEQKTENGSSSICPTIDSRTSTIDGKIFLRGQGLIAEPDDIVRAHERRQKALEYQREVQRQMEEKKSKDREEKQRKILEEQEEEKRLEAERLRMQKEYEEEQHRQKEKEELGERKRKVLIAAMEQAQAAAEAARKATKAQRFQSCPELSFTQRKTPNEQDTSSHVESKENTVEEENKPKVVTRLDQRTATVHPVQNSSPAPESKQQREFAVQTTVMPESSGYIENRVLTPTVVRMKEKARSQHKEFGTQTDFQLVDHWLADDTYSPVSTSSSVTNIEPSRKNRIQHSLPTKVSQSNYVPLLNQRKWGVSAQQKPFIKMSERDPHYHKRKRLLELRKQHWEREVASQKAFTETRRSIFSSQSTNKPLCRKKVMSSSEGSLSSSEGEEKYDNEENIHSLPCFLKRCHYQQIHGSADDVTGRVGYENTNRDYHSDSLSSPMQRRRLAQSTENLLSYPFSESLHSRTTRHNLTFPSGQSHHHPSMRRKWHSQETFLPHSPNIFSIRSTSPPVPAVKKRLGEQKDDTDTYHAPRRKWTDQEGYSPEDIPSSSAHCTSSSPFDGNENNDGRKPDTDQDPLVHPEVVTRRPTARQDKILMQLSSLRKGLLLKQRELESQLLRPACETS